MICHQCQSDLEFDPVFSCYQCPQCKEGNESTREPMPRMNIRPLFCRDRSNNELLYTDVRRFCICGHEYKMVRVNGPEEFNVNNPNTLKAIRRGLEEHSSRCFTVPGNEWLAPDWYLKTLEEDDD